jgi:serine/threonine protein kinase
MKHILKGVLSGIIFLESHFVLHNDISLANILVEEYNERNGKQGLLRVRIADFGLAFKLQPEEQIRIPPHRKLDAPWWRLRTPPEASTTVDPCLLLGKSDAFQVGLLMDGLLEPLLKSSPSNSIQQLLLLIAILISCLVPATVFEKYVPIQTIASLLRNQEVERRM